MTFRFGVCALFLELAEPQCTVRHALANASSEGEIGPDFDALAELDRLCRLRGRLTRAP